jgi:hypothetical protein
MRLAAVAALAQRIGAGEPVAIVEFAAVDRNCSRLIGWSKANRITWRPAFKTLRSPELLAYVLGKLDRPKVMIHHLRDVPQALPPCAGRHRLPDGLSADARRAAPLHEHSSRPRRAPARAADQRRRDRTPPRTG